MEQRSLHQELYEAVDREYVTQGAIYGRTHEGLMRWWMEVAEIYRSTQEALFWHKRHLELGAEAGAQLRQAAVHNQVG